MKRIIKNLNSIWNKFKSSNKDFWEDIEEQLISSDISVNTAMMLVENVREKAYQENINEKRDLVDIFKNEIYKILDDSGDDILNITDSPSAIMLVGVNGVGKTSSAAKLAKMLKDSGKKIIFAAADTFRAAAVEQLTHFSKMLDIDIVYHQRYSDPGAVVYDSIQKAKAKGIDNIIIDTAGRMQTSYNLMGELKKINKVIEKNLGKKPDEILMIIDATTGQNAKSQIEIFNQSIDITGIILTKIDSMAKGGMILTIKNDYGIPIKLYTHGEKIGDIKRFDPRRYVDQLFDEND